MATIDLRSESDTTEEAGSSPSSSGSSLQPLSGHLKQDLRQCLDCVESSGTFASFGTMEYFIDPQIYLDGRRISLPLSEHDSQRIIQASHKAPFGKGSKTIVDTSVRNTWEINRDNFQMRNPDWNKYMHVILVRGAEELGISSGPQIIGAHL